MWPYRPVPLPDRVVHELTDRHPDPRVRGIRLSGPTVPSLLTHAVTADIAVLGTRGAGGFAGLAVGSTALGAAQRCDRPVVLVPGNVAEGTEPRADRVTLGIDARRPADAALDFAFAAAHQRNVRLRAVHAWALPSPAAEWMPFALPEEDRAKWEDDENQVLSDALRPWQEKYPDVPVLKDVVLHSTAKALVRASRSTELLVVGRCGTALGSAVNALIHHTKSPVVVVPS